MKAHKIADIFPMMSEKEFKELKKDIKQNGFLKDQPILIFDGKILDGRNRYKACKELGIDPPTKQWKGNDPLQYVISTNLHRRHLNTSQKGIVGDRICNLKVGENQHRSIDLPTLEQASSTLAIGVKTIQRARTIRQKKPEEIKEIEMGKKKLDAVYREIKQEEQKEEIKKLKEIKGEYEIVVIDPPWQYDDRADPNNNRGVTDYPTMTIQELKRIKIPSSENSVLWLWTTNSFMKEAYELLEAWGFDAKTILTWDKVSSGMGHYLKNKTEHCILGIRGNVVGTVIDNIHNNWTTLISEKKTKHSKKPDGFYKMVDEICTGRRLDYFARNKRKGWDVYGDEVDGN